ncbi:MAG: quinone oxidoreductase [Legionella sp. 40-6]|nr:zinc-dependent alcohol dehydrogenase family protein [Legionella sp.]OJX98934.1 MAG: quinone oxidoreductase [Legionella sp. 40-6]
MKAAVISAFGDTSQFKVEELAKPVVKEGYVLVKVIATSVNPVDCKIRSGKYGELAPAFPAVLHGDFAGIIEEVGPGVTEFKVGDEVYGCAGGFKEEPGALAEYMLADAQLIAPKPKNLTMLEAAALPLVAITAWEALFEKINLTAKQNILVHAGVGGVGHIAVQLAKWAGAKVYATISSVDKAALAQAMGADETINYRAESVAQYVQRCTDGHGFDVVFDTVGGDNLAQSLAAVSLYGTVATIQAHGAHDLTSLHMHSASLHAVFMLIPLLYSIQRARHGHILRKITELVEQGHLRPLISPKQFSLDDVGEAHALLESGKAIGKVGIQVQNP